MFNVILMVNKMKLASAASSLTRQQTRVEEEDEDDDVEEEDVVDGSKTDDDQRETFKNNRCECGWLMLVSFVPENIEEAICCTYQNSPDWFASHSLKHFEIESLYGNSTVFLSSSVFTC